MYLGHKRCPEIAAELGVTRQCVWLYVKETIAELNEQSLEDAKEWRLIEDAKLCDALAKLQPLVDKGKLPAIDRWLKIMERRSKMWGVDMAADIDRARLELDKQKRSDDHAKNELELKRLEALLASGIVADVDQPVDITRLPMEKRLALLALLSELAPMPK